MSIYSSWMVYVGLTQEGHVRVYLQQMTKCNVSPAHASHVHLRVEDVRAPAHTLKASH